MRHPDDPSMARIVAVAARASRAPVGVMRLVDGRNWTSGEAMAGLTSEGTAAAFEGPCARVVGAGAVVVPDVSAEPPSSSSGPAPAGAAAWAGVRVLGAQGQVLGALVVSDGAARPWSADDLEALDVLARATSAELGWREAVEAARDRSGRLTFLADASALLSSLPDSAGLPARLTRFCVPAAAQAALIDSLDGDQLTRVGVAHADPRQQSALEALPVTSRARSAGGRVARVLASSDGPDGPDGPDGADVDLARLTDDDALHLALEDEGAPWVITAALRARGATLGVLTWVAAPGQVYSVDDLSLARDFASRAAQAWERAQLFDERTAVAATLQASLLPARLPEVAGMELASRYVAADAAVEVGGDFYDVFPATDGQWVAVMGDVTGRGVEAAGMTGLARHTLRALGRGTPPARLLGALNAALCEAAQDERFATVACVRFSPGGSGAGAGAMTRMTLASGGHCSPVVVRADGSVELLDVPGTVLGLFEDVDVVDVEAALAPGDAVVLYTDGVIEARRAGELFGEERLMQVLGQAPATSAEELASRVLAAVDAYRTQGADDDLAILVLRASPAPAVPEATEPAVPNPRTAAGATAAPSSVAGSAQRRGRDLVFSEQAVARLTASSPAQLSAWADRYGLVVPGRTRAGVAAYTGAQLAALRMVARQLEAGVDEAAAHAVLAGVLAAVASSAASVPAPSPVRGGEQVLLVDRDPHLLALLAAALSAAGWQAVTASTAAAVESHLRQHPVAAAVVEVLLAGESGLDVAAQLVRHHVPVVSISSLRAVDEAFAAGAQAFATKPLDADALTRAVAELTTPLTSLTDPL